jgi:hypothetical protein
MPSVPFVEQYALLKSRGLPPLAAVVTMCRSNPGRVSWILEWFARKNPDAGAFGDRWLKCRQTEAQDWKIFVGSADEGCYLYCSFAHRPGPTVFIKWDDIGSIYVQDGQHMLALAVYSSGLYGGKFLQAQSDTLGFTSFVEEVSQRFFGARSYLDSIFKRGGHDIRKFQVWPKNELVERSR